MKGGFWDGLKVCGVGNFEEGEVGFFRGDGWVFGEFWVDLGSGRDGEGLLDDWVSLGKEMEEIWRPVRGSEGRRQLLNFRGGRRRILLGFSCSLWCSLRWQKVWKEEQNSGFIKGLEAAGHELWIQISTSASTAADGEAAGEETGSKCPPEEPLREERVEASCCSR